MNGGDAASQEPGKKSSELTSPRFLNLCKQTVTKLCEPIDPKKGTGAFFPTP